MEFTGEINDSDIEDIARDVVENYDFTYTIEAVLDYDGIARYVEGELDGQFLTRDDVDDAVGESLNNAGITLDLSDHVAALQSRVETLENALRALADVVKPNPTVTTTYPIVGG